MEESTRQAMIHGAQENPAPAGPQNGTAVPPTPRKPRDLGFINGEPPEQTPDKIYLPNALRFVTWDYSKPSSERIQRYGKWKVKAIKSFALGFDKYAEPGDTLEMIGDDARLVVENRQAVFIDEKILEEKAILEKADAIRKNNPVRENPEKFGIDKRPKNSWMGGMLQGKP